MMGRRARGTQLGHATWPNIVRGISSEGFGRIRYHTAIRRLLDTDRSVPAFFEGESRQVPALYVERLRRDMGQWWDYLPAGALEHDPEAYLARECAAAVPLTDSVS